MSAPDSTPAPSSSTAADCSPEALLRATRRAAELGQAWTAGLRERSVRPEVSAAAQFPGSLGDEGIGLDRCVEELGRAMEGSMAVPGPMYFGLLNSTPLPMAPIADLVVSTLNNNAGADEQSPAGTAAEQEVLRAFGHLVDPGGPPRHGMLLPGGTFANLQALVVARDRARQNGVERGRIYCGATRHFSVQRSTHVIGIASEDLVKIPTIGRGALDPAALRRELRTDRERGIAPIAVVATAGSTPTGSLDALAEIAEICEEHEAWLHVDACYGGAALLLDELRSRFRGIERSDSVALDPHKWFFCPLVASVVLFRDAAAPLHSFDVDVSYIPRDPEQRPDHWRCGLPTSRRAMGLTVWATLRAHGFGEIRDAVRRNVAQARAIESGLAAQGFEVLPDGELSIACARFVPEGRTDDEVDRLQTRIAQAVCDSGDSWFSTIHHQGRTWLSIRVTNRATEDQHVVRLVERIAEEARRLT